MMHRTALTILFVLCSTTLLRADLVYRLSNYPLLQDGHHVDGTMTTIDSAPDDGLLMSAELLDWEFTVSGPTPFSAAMGPGSPNPIYGQVDISETSISIGFPLVEGDVNELVLSNGGPSIRYVFLVDFEGPGVIDLYDGRPATSGSDAWQSTVPFTGSAGWTVATAAAPTAVVPEPTSVVIWSLGGLFFGLVAWKRSRK